MVFSLKLKAQIYRAGDITYTWISGYTYKIKLTNFTSYSSSLDPCTDTLCTGEVMIRGNGPCGGSCSPFGCSGTPLSSNPAININNYEITHTYPGPGSYLLCVDDKNRNQGIVNIPNSTNQSMALTSLLVIPSFGSGKNSAPVFSNPPLATGCLSAGCFLYNPGAVDVEGDSLSYEIASCQNTSGTIPGYSFPNAGASGTFSIDPATGTLSWCNPQFAGDYNVVIKVSEWRNDGTGNYSLVGYVNRDTQFTMSVCTGLHDISEKENLIAVFPNPVTENLTITFNQNNGELFTIDLMDITGRNIKTVITKESTIQLQTENIKPGIYFLKIAGNNNTTLTKKIIKQ